MANSQESQYIELLRELITASYSEKMKNDRTGTGIWSLFGRQLFFSLDGGILPLITTKRVFFRGVVEELLWILRGETSVKGLSDKGIKIWNENTTDPQYIKRTGNKKFDIGPGYGFQLRHFGGEYKHPLGISPGGVDQLRLVLDLIMTNPRSRRILWSYWNPHQQEKMCLPPCHFCYQFYVDNDGTLSCMMSQRSSDAFLGLPFNIASVSLLVFIISTVCDLSPGRVIISLGDVHLYSNHVIQATEQICRPLYNFPTFKFKNTKPIPSDLDGKISWIESLNYENFEVIGYKSHPSIKAKMAV